MLINQIWKTVNVSSILVLPIFNKEMDKFTHRSNGVTYLFNQLCFDSGLINTFLSSDINKCDTNNKYLHLMFDSQALASSLGVRGVTSPYFSLNEAIMDSIFFDSFYFYNGLSILTLKIPSNLINDILLIEDNKYSKVSDDYKELLSPFISRVLKKESDIGYQITKTNLAEKIVLKSSDLRKELSHLLSETISKEQEYYTVFVEEKETLTFNQINKAYHL